MTGFAMLLPPEWVLIDLKGSRRAGVQDVLRGWLSGLSAEQASAARPVLLARLEKLTSEMSEQGILALIAQAASLNEVGVQPMLAVRPLDVPEDVEPLDLLIGLAGSDASAELIEVEGMVGLRTTSVGALTADVDAAVATLPGDLQARASAPDAQAALVGVGRRKAHRRRYLLGVPDDRTQWVELFGTVEVGDEAEGDALASAYLDLFDSLVKSFEWRR